MWASSSTEEPALGGLATASRVLQKILLFPGLVDVSLFFFQIAVKYTFFQRALVKLPLNKKVTTEPALVSLCEWDRFGFFFSPRGSHSISEHELDVAFLMIVASCF